jgi:hypothetical protein
MTLDGEGIDAWEPSDDERFEAGKAFSRMEELGIEGVSLSEIVEQYHELMPKQDDMTLEQLREGFLVDFTRRLKKGKSVRTLRSYRYKTKVLVDAFPGQTARLLQESECWRCHKKMDPLGLPFEMFNHVGLFREKEKGNLVDTSGEIITSGDPKLDGKVSGTFEMIQKLANSERVEQVFVRHVFRFWIGREETLVSAPGLPAP